MTPNRFGLRTVMVVMLLLALGLAYGPYMLRRAKYADHYRRLTEAAANWKREQHRKEGYSFQAANDTWLSVHTAELWVADDYSRAIYYGAKPDPRRFFVVPPGKWVDTIDEVFAVWDEYD